jgi:hypothetical protein
MRSVAKLEAYIMPIHDWTRVEARFFHSFSFSWFATISGRLNTGVLPSTHYSLTENQRDGRTRTFIDLGERDTPFEDRGKPGSLLYASELPPSTSYHDVGAHPEYADKVITIRRSAFNDVVAAIRIVAPYTKRSHYKMSQFVGWTVEVLREGISVLIIDLFGPGPQDPHGTHKAIWDEFVENGFVLPPDTPLTFASYLARPIPEALVDLSSIGSALPDMPLFLDADSYVSVPLAATYDKAFDSEPKHIREILGGKGSGNF